MSTSFEMSADVRSDLGKAATRRLRNAGSVPAVIYGGDDQEPTSITMVHDDLMHNLENEAFYSHILSISVDGTKEEVVLKDLQRHPSKARVLHADFQRVGGGDISMHVPLHFLNEEDAPGIKLGGALNRLMASVEVSCQAAVLPEHLEVDLAGMEIGDSVRLSQIPLPEGVSIPALARGEDYDQAIATVQKTRGSQSDDEDEEAGADGEEAAPAEGDAE